MIIEICCDGFGKALSACEAGADRIELCQELPIGGTTPELRENGRRVNGVVFGALLRDGSVDADATREMVREAHRQGLSTTFHRAIDESADIFSSLQAIMDIGGIDRILTSGGASDAYSGRQTIAEMVAKAAGRISIMAGCGVTAANATAIAAATGIHEIHGSRLEIISAMKSEQASST